MMFALIFTEQAIDDLHSIAKSPHLKKRLKAVRKALAFLEKNPKHPSLHTHKFFSQEGSKGEEIFEAYAENNTPGAYRIFWHYGPNKKQITIVAIIPHP
jgi:hypothetical protein